MIYLELGIEPIDFFVDLWWEFYLQRSAGIEMRQSLIDSFTELGVRLAKEYISDPHYQLLFQDKEAEIYFEVSNGDDVSSYLYVGMRSADVLPTDSYLARLNADRFLEYGKVCYRVLQPLYAFAENLNTLIEREDVEKHHLTRVCWAQFFGPDFVEGLGRGVLMRAPAWRNENLDDGGILYVLSETPYQYKGPRQCWNLARKYFEQHLPNSIKQWSDMPT